MVVAYGRASAEHCACQLEGRALWHSLAPSQPARVVDARPSDRPVTLSRGRWPFWGMKIWLMYSSRLRAALRLAVLMCVMGGLPARRQGICRDVGCAGGCGSKCEAEGVCA